MSLEEVSNFALVLCRLCAITFRPNEELDKASRDIWNLVRAGTRFSYDKGANKFDNLLEALLADEKWNFQKVFDYIETLKSSPEFVEICED